MSAGWGAAVEMAHGKRCPAAINIIKFKENVYGLVYSIYMKMCVNKLIKQLFFLCKARNVVFLTIGCCCCFVISFFFFFFAFKVGIHIWKTTENSPSKCREYNTTQLSVRSGERFQGLSWWRKDGSLGNHWELTLLHSHGWERCEDTLPGLYDIRG